jgi:LmbE family N-acetylglucosaminyl deacetylase
MVGVPNVAPDTPPLRKNPVFLYSQDNFQRPNPFRPDVTIDITAVFEKKVDAMAAHESQVYEWLPWIGGYAAEVPVDKSERRKWLSNRYRAVPLTAAVRKSLELWYGKEQAEKIQFAEAFEICEYGTQPGADDLTRLFPMLKKKN